MKYLITIITLIAATFRVAAQTPVTTIIDGPTLSTSISETYVSEYSFRGTILGGASLQPNLGVSYGAVNLGVWASTPLRNQDKVAGQSDPEIDLSGGYTASINSSLSVQPGFTLYTYPRAPLADGFYRSTFEPNVAVNYTVAGITLTPKVYYDAVLRGATYELGAGYAVPLKSLATELDLAATVGSYLLTDAVNGASARAWGSYESGGVTVPLAITKDLKVSGGYALTRGSGAYTKQGRSPKQAASDALTGVVSITAAWSF